MKLARRTPNRDGALIGNGTWGDSFGHGGAIVRYTAPTMWPVYGADPTSLRCRAVMRSHRVLDELAEDAVRSRPTETGSAARNPYGKSSIGELVDR